MDARIALLAILIGVILGVALAVSDWRSKFTIGSILTAAGGFATSLTADKVQTVQSVIERTGILSPILYALNIALGTFVLTLLGGSATVFLVNYVPAKRRGDPEAFVEAGRRTLSVFIGGLHRYVTVPPHMEAANTIRELEKQNSVLEMIQRTLIREATNGVRGRQHFKDVIEVAGRVVLQFSFGDTPNLQRYRMAMFERKGDQLAYLVAINNNDWTAHSMKGFGVASSFMGEAIKRDRALVYPRHKKRKVPFVERAGERYKSFVAIPIPCGGGGTNIGVLTVDYTGSDAVFTERRVTELYALAQLMHGLYLLTGAGTEITSERAAQ